MRALEDLIIDAIYADILRGKLNQQQAVLEVSWSMGRDLAPGELEQILDLLRGWAGRTKEVVSVLDQKIESIKENEKKKAKDEEEYLESLTERLKEVVANAARNGNGSGNKGGRGAVPRGFGGYGGKGIDEDDAMDVDEVENNSGGGRGLLATAVSELRGKKK